MINPKVVYSLGLFLSGLMAIYSIKNNYVIGLLIAILTFGVAFMFLAIASPKDANSIKGVKKDE